MVNKLLTTDEKNGAKKFFSSIILTGTTLLFLLQPGFSRDNEKVKLAIKETLEHYDTKKYTIQETDNIDNTTINFEQAQSNLEGDNDVFNFALNNVDKYYPDMKKHLTDMIKQFGTDKERKDTVTNIFNQTIMTIQDPKQRIGAIIYALEGYVFRESDFGDTHDADITQETFLIMEKARVKYETRLKNRLKDIEKIHASIKKHQQELEQSKVELEKSEIELEKSKQDLAKVNQQLIDILNKVSVQDVKTKENIRKLVIETKAMFFKYGTSSINPHIDQLFSLVP